MAAGIEPGTPEAAAARPGIALPISGTAEKKTLHPGEEAIFKKGLVCMNAETAFGDRGMTTHSSSLVTRCARRMQVRAHRCSPCSPCSRN
jgi:hypothetical protein